MKNTKIFLIIAFMAGFAGLRASDQDGAARNEGPRRKLTECLSKASEANLEELNPAQIKSKTDEIFESLYARSMVSDDEIYSVIKDLTPRDLMILSLPRLSEAAIPTVMGAEDYEEVKLAKAKLYIEVAFLNAELAAVKKYAAIEKEYQQSVDLN